LKQFLGVAPFSFLYKTFTSQGLIVRLIITLSKKVNNC